MMSKVYSVAALSAALLLSACSPANKLVGEWQCDSHTALTFKDDGAFKIVSTASQQGAALEGHYSVKENIISVEGPVMEPLSHSTTITVVGPRDLVLTNGGYDVHSCSRAGAGEKN